MNEWLCEWLPSWWGRYKSGWTHEKLIKVGEQALASRMEGSRGCRTRGGSGMSANFTTFSVPFFPRRLKRGKLYSLTLALEGLAITGRESKATAWGRLGEVGARAGAVCKSPTVTVYNLHRRSHLLRMISSTIKTQQDNKASVMHRLTSAGRLHLQPSLCSKL